MVTAYTLMVSCPIDAIEKWTIYTANIPGVFLQSYWPEHRP